MNIKKPFHERAHEFIERNMLPFCMGFMLGAFVVVMRML